MHPAMQDQSPPCISSRAVHRIAQRSGGARVTDVRMPLAEILGEVGIADPHQALRAMLLRLRLELVAKPVHHARQIRAAIAVSLDAVLPLVLGPEVLGRARE